MKHSRPAEALFWLLTTGRVVGVGEGPWEGRTYPDVVKRRFVGDVIQQEQGWRGTDRGDQGISRSAAEWGQDRGPSLTLSISVIRVGHTAEAFLSCRVPDLGRQRGGKEQG